MLFNSLNNKLWYNSDCSTLANCLMINIILTTIKPKTVVRLKYFHVEWQKMWTFTVKPFNFQLCPVLGFILIACSFYLAPYNPCRMRRYLTLTNSFEVHSCPELSIELLEFAHSKFLKLLSVVEPSLPRLMPTFQPRVRSRQLPELRSFISPLRKSKLRLAEKSRRQ